MTYDDIRNWVERNFDVNNYFTDSELLYEVEARFNKDNHIFPEQARDSIRELFLNRDVYREIERRDQQDQLAADMLGSGHVMRSLSDEIIEEYRRPEIMDIDMTTLPTYKEDVTRPEIRKFTRQEKFKGNVVSSVKRFIRWFKG